ncbi:MAG: ATP-dependent DNA helicase [Crocinitomicaceae bacterium]|nr:ATP-dependent DNA helicase [Crocinitomicaceae bacterium]|tara:strand:+ start:1233 stop:3494 length:2262 start_codon:yes stop_codon:yes gene_type:complete
MDVFEGLNSAQIDAVKVIDGPMMIIAGAGSGKTKVLTHRTANLINNGVDPFNILALTFTNKAAKEMKHRISSMVGENEARNIWMGTFHSIFAKILRFEHQKIGYPSNFTIYDTQDSKSVIKSIIKEKKLDDKLYKPGIVYNRISAAKNSLISAKNYIESNEIKSSDRSTGRPFIGEIYLSYQNKCFRSGAMDFDDLLFKTNVLLQQYPEVLYKYQEKFKYILVDEYQDTNHAQYLIVKSLAARFENICVVGDDAQSIYSFRGANIQNILNFRKDYPDYKLFKLEQNYRSTKTIVNAANSIIKLNKDQIKKKVWTSNIDGEKIKILKAYSDNEEGKIIANHIFEEANNQKTAFYNFAILYRTNAQSRSFEESLRKLNIPYKIFGGLSFYQRKEIKDLLAYFRLSANLKDEESLKRIINYPKRGIGLTTLNKALICANHNNVSIWDVLVNPNKFGFILNGATKAKIESFITMIKHFNSIINKDEAYNVALEIAKQSEIIKNLSTDKTPEGIVRFENIQELLNGIQEFSKSNEQEDKITLADFMLDVALLTDADNENEEDNNKVSMMTIHASKGLEFQYIYIVGLEENLFPSQLSLNSRNDLEEERRLFYVALTRAKNKATLSYSASRFKWGNFINCEPSRFIEELDPAFVIESYSKNTFEQKKVKQESLSSSKNIFIKPQRNLKRIKKTTSSIPIDSSEMSKIKIGSEVLHERFGKGKIIEIQGTFPNTKATVFFPSSGQKQLLLKFAKLQLIKN